MPSGRSGTIISRRVVLGHVSEHMDQHDLARSFNGSCLTQHYSYQAEAGRTRFRTRSVDTEWNTGIVLSRIASLICINFDQ